MIVISNENCVQCTRTPIFGKKIPVIVKAEIHFVQFKTIYNFVKAPFPVENQL